MTDTKPPLTPAESEALEAVFDALLEAVKEADTETLCRVLIGNDHRWFMPPEPYAPQPQTKED